MCVHIERGKMQHKRHEAKFVHQNQKNYNKKQPAMQKGCIINNVYHKMADSIAVKKGEGVQFQTKNEGHDNTVKIDVVLESGLIVQNIGQKRVFIHTNNLV